MEKLLRIMITDPTLVKLSESLRKSRTPLTKACQVLGIDPEYVDVDALQVKCCDWCSFWDTPRNMTIEEDGTVYCKTCVESDYM